MKIEHFSDGEFSVSYEESIRGQYVYLVQSTFPNSDNLMELLLMIDAAKRASAYKVIAVIPYFGWARQDRKRQTPCVNCSQTYRRYAERGWCRPCDYYGFTR
jgi:ribose-phosphate pyrophosphokinase